MPVFISHKREDSSEAAVIATILTNASIQVYIDLLDPELKTTDDITAVLLKRLADCTHLMAVVSDYTERSWWVPFEIGAATQSDRRISTFTRLGRQLPDYLSKWPVLSQYSHLDKFIAEYRSDQRVIALTGDWGGGRPAYRTSDIFHANLKRSISGV